MSRSDRYLKFILENLPYLAAGFLLMFISGLGQTYFVSIFSGEIRGAFQLSDGDWGFLYMVSTGLSAIVMVFAGTLADRFRIRGLSAAVIALLAVGCVLISQITSVYALFAVIFCLRFAGQGMASHLAVVAMSRWFIATRGRAIAVASLGFMIGEATMPLIMVWLKSFIDWRTLWIGFSFFALAMIPILFVLLAKERQPSTMARADESTGMGGRHWSRAEVIRTPLFWMLAPAVALLPAFGTAFWFHQVHFAEIKGWTHLALVAVFPLSTITLAFSTILYGWLIDKVGAVRLLPVYLTPVVFAFFLHGLSTETWTVGIAMILMGLAGGGQATVLSACWAEIYGTKHLGAIKSAIAALMVAGSAAGPWITGALIDAGVSYERQLIWIAGIFAAAALFQFVPRNKILALTP
ncbi:MFS transporter [Cognatiyoonia sp.]|uniref:MFS transporter n=1 Tax=Cognatiyoonia sp. TaxID=2211652 RepID=UPI003F6976BD